MVLATIFVSLPFVVREVIPVLREIGTEQEQAAATLGRGQLQTFFRDHAAGDPLGRRLRRRADDGARARRVRRGQHRVGQALRPHRDRDAVRGEPRSSASTRPAAYAASVVLALLAFATLLAMNLIKPKEAQ